MKLGVICDGISRDLAHTLKVMDEFDLRYAELQFVGEKEVGDHDDREVREIKALLEQHGKLVSCVSRHVFAGMTSANKPGDSGAEKWNVAHGAWDALLQLIAPACELARAEGLTLVVETGNGTMVNSSYTGRKLIDDLDAKDVLKVLWDPANNCWCHEKAYPDGYNELSDGYLGHVHIKDVLVDTPRSTLQVCPMGQGQLADQFQPMADALRADNYNGVISFESVYHNGDGDFENGFRQCISQFRKLFG